MKNLCEEKCTPCKIGTPTMTNEEIKKYIDKIDFNWKVKDNKKIERNYEFRNFKETIKFVNMVADIAEREGHHPNMFIFGWNKLRIDLYTHKINGLSKVDFVMAAKIDEIDSKPLN